MDQPVSDLEAGYDRVAEQYAAEFFDELTRKPFDCAMLDSFARRIRGQGLVYELGCGPGHVARYLKDRGVEMRGLDLSSEMVKVAGRLNPDIIFEQGDMANLKIAEQSLGGIVLFYSIIHLEKERVTDALTRMRCTLQVGGEIFLAFHAGEGKVHRDEWYGEPVSIDFRFFTGEEMTIHLDEAGYQDIKITQREPYDFEYPTPRCYVTATAPW
jgi:SAM-dependent methyltransferase